MINNHACVVGLFIIRFTTLSYRLGQPLCLLDAGTISNKNCRAIPENIQNYFLNIQSHFKNIQSYSSHIERERESERQI